MAEKKYGSGLLECIVAISGRIEKKNGAWEFVKYFLIYGYDEQGFPIVQKQFDQVIDDAMTENYDDGFLVSAACFLCGGNGL